MLLSTIKNLRLLKIYNYLLEHFPSFKFYTLKRIVLPEASTDKQTNNNFIEMQVI